MNEEKDISELISVLLLLVVALVIVLVRNRIKKRHEETAEKMKPILLKNCKSIISQNKKELALERSKMVFSDPYGKEVLSKWYDEGIPYFITHHIIPQLSVKERDHFHLVTESVFKEIDMVSKRTKLNVGNFNKSMTGFDYENYCAQILEKAGWKVQKTASGPDQGIDLIINLNSLKYGVKCKKYSRPIGNKAVQEVKAGISHYGLTKGIVIGSSTFTASAKSLAKTNGVKLIHHSQIDELKKMQ
jgi:restriction system protein